MSSANLFDNSEAQRQDETSGKEERNRQVGCGDARGRATSRNASAVNGPLGERAPPLREQQGEKQLENNSVRQRTRPRGGFARAESANHEAESLPAALFSNPSPSKGKIEAYIDAVYEQAMKERAVKQAVKHESDNRNKDLLVESDLSTGSYGDSTDRFRESGRRILDRISDGRSSICGPITDNLQTTKFIGDYDFRKLKSREFNSQCLDRSSDGRSPSPDSVADDPRNPTTKLTKSEGEQGFTKMGSKEDNRELENCERSVNFSESRNREEMAMDRSRAVAQPENTFDYTPTFPAIHSSRIPEESRFSRRTEKNAFHNGDNTLLDNGSFPGTVEFFLRSGISFGSNTGEDINYGIASSTTKSNSFEGNVVALLSRIMMSETRSSTEGAERQRGFRASENVSDNVNALRNAPVVRKNLSAAAIRPDNTSGGERKTENANVSTRISTAPAFTRLRNLSSSTGRLEELSTAAIAVAVAARSRDKSLTKILELKTRDSLSTNEIRGFPGDFGNLYVGRESRGMYNSSERAPKDVNLRNKFWKPRRKLRKSKGAEKFRGDGRKSTRFGKSSRGLTRRRGALSDFERDILRNEFSKRERRFRRHLQTGEEVFNTVDARDSGLTDEGSRREAQTSVDYYTRPKVARSKRKTSNFGGNEKKQVMLESGYSFRKVQPEENENPFHFSDKDSKKSSVDKRIEDKFVRISNVLKEDSTGTGIIQETPENFKVVTKSEVAKADIPKIQNELGDNLFSRENGKSDERFAIHGDEIAHERSAELNNTRQRLKGNPFATMGSASNATTITSLITQKDFADHKESIFLKSVDPSPSPSITRKLDYNVTKKIDFNKSKDPTCITEFATRQTRMFTQEFSTNTPRGENVNDYFEVTDGPLRTLSNNWTRSSKETALNNRSEDERDETENAKFLELNNASRITGNFESEGQSIHSGLLSRGNASIAESKEIPSSDEEGVGPDYTEDPHPKNAEDFLERSREKEEIAKLVDRIVRQYAAYTPIMPGMPTFDEITEAETLPPEEESPTTVTQFTTTLATTTKITDVAFRPSIRLLEPTTSLPGEMHDEISLDETTFVDETEATATTRKKTVSKPRSDTNASPTAKVRKVSSKTGKSGKRQRITGRVTNIKLTNAVEEVEDHPWYQTTEVQQIIAANRSKSIQRTGGKRKKHGYKSGIDYVRHTSSARTSSTTVSAGVAHARGKRSDFIRATSNSDSSVFHDYGSEDEEARRGGRTGLNKKSPNITESTELRSTIEKRLADELDYPARRVPSRDNRESRDQAQKLNAALQDIAARNVRLTVEDNLDSGAEEKGPDVLGDPKKNFILLKLRHVKANAVHKFDKNISSRNREATLMSRTSPSGAIKIPSRADLSGSVRERLEIDRRSEERESDGRVVAELDEIAVNARTAGAADLSDRGAKPRREKSSAGGILPGRARSPGNRDKSRETVIRGVKLMIPDDKGGTRELDIAAKSVDKKIPPLFAARQQGREDARKINENPADCRVSAGKQYLRRPRGKVYDTVRKIINKIKGELSSVSDEVSTKKGSGRRANRSSDWRRSGRRLLSNGRSSYDDEYYANDESETDRENDSSDDKAIAKRDDLPYLENRSDRRKDRDLRKSVAEPDQLADGNADVAQTMTPEEKIIAINDAAMLSDDMQENSEETISRLLIADINFNRDGILINAKISPSM